MSAARQCEACGSPLAGDQRYCLLCGTRAGGRSAQLDTLLRSVRSRPPRGGDVPPGDGRDAPGTVAPAAMLRRQPRLPGPWVSAMLVLVFVGFGALLGDAGAGAGRLPPASPALKLLVAHSAPLPTTSVPATGGGESASSGGEAPASESEAPASTEAAAPASAGSSPSGAGEAGETGKSKSGSEAAPAKKPKQAAPATAKLRDIKHVFEIVLSDQPYAADFGPESKATYLAHVLESKGELLLRYVAIAHEQLPNGVALLSGQGPTAQTAANCPSYTPLTPATPGPDEQLLGDGCIYPRTVQTLPGQLTAKHLAWRAYVQGTDEGAGTPPACSHPAPGALDPSAATGPYATFRNPFLYFASITESPECASADVGLAQLSRDLKGAPASVPAFSYIAPDRCNDGGSSACSPGAVAGPSDSGPLLSRIVPEIMASKAYKKAGLIVITTDEAPSTGEYGDSSSCCGQPAYPNLTTVGLRHGGGVVGALLLSPFIKGATTTQEQYNHYSLLRSVEDIFGLGHIGYAALPTVKSFSATLLNKPLRR